MARWRFGSNGGSVRARRRASARPPRPGEVLRRLLAASGDITQGQLAQAMGVTRYSVNQLVKGHRAVTVKMAMLLSRALATSPEFWLNLQRSVDLDRAIRDMREHLRSVKALREPISERDLFYDLPS